MTADFHLCGMLGYLAHYFFGIQEHQTGPKIEKMPECIKIHGHKEETFNLSSISTRSQAHALATVCRFSQPLNISPILFS